jgi:hypothetical protein
MSGAPPSELYPMAKAYADRQLILVRVYTGDVKVASGFVGNLLPVGPV